MTYFNLNTHRPDTGTLLHHGPTEPGMRQAQVRTGPVLHPDVRVHYTHVGVPDQYLAEDVALSGGCSVRGLAKRG